MKRERVTTKNENGKNNANEIKRKKNPNGNSIFNFLGKTHFLIACKIKVCSK